MSSEKQRVSKKRKEKEKSSQNKTNIIDRFKGFCNGVRQEIKRVHWTSSNDILKYSVSTFIFVIFFSLFFYLIDVIFALVHSIIG